MIEFSTMVRLYFVAGHPTKAGEGIFCTELIDQAMPELGLPRRNLYGRQIISPDDIARSAATGKAGLRIISYVAGFPHGWEVLEPAELKKDLEAAIMRD